MKASEHLRAALKLLNGTWVNHKPNYGSEQQCILTALSRTGEFVIAINQWRASKYLSELIIDIHSWNDAPYRTFKEVTAVFNKAIEAAEKDDN